MEQSRESLIGRVALLSSALMLLWMGRALILGEVPLTGDLLHTHYPIRDFYARALANGQRFDWMPSLFGGFDLVGEGQAGVYHPLHWLWYRLLPLDVAFMVEMLAAYPLMFAGAWLFLRRWCDSGSAAFGAMIFTFCGFNLEHGVHPNMVTVVAHLPWLLLCIHAAFAAGSWPPRAALCAAIAALTGSEILLGHPQAVWISGLAEAAYVLFMLGATARGTRAAAALAIAGGKMLGLVVGAIQIVATFDASVDSTRAGFDAAFPFQFSMPWLYLLQLLAPYVLWGRVVRWTEVPGAGDEVAVYGGSVTLVLIVWWAARSWQQRRSGRPITPSDRFALAGIVLAVCGLWLALGREGGIYYLQTLLPVVGRFRAPLRFVLLTHLGLATASAVALMQLSRLTSDERAVAARAARWTWTLPAASLLLAAGLLLAPPLDGAAPRETLLAYVLAPVLLAAAAALITLASRRSRVALAGLVLLAAVDQAVYGLGGVVAWHDFATRAAVIELLGPKESLPPTEPDRVVCCPYPNLNILAGYRTIDAYLGLVPARELDYRTQPALRLAQVRYAHRIAVEASRIPDAQRIGPDWFELPAPVARARLVTEARVSRNVARDLATLDVDRSAFVSHDLALPAGVQGTAAITRDNPGQIGVHTRATTRQLLVVSEMFHDGWAVTVDGRPGTVERVNGDFLGAVVPEGDHNIELAFQPRYRSIGGAFSLAGIGACLALAAISWFCHRPFRRGQL